MSNLSASSQISLFADEADVVKDLKQYFSLQGAIKAVKLADILKGMSALLAAITSDVPEEDAPRLTDISFAFPLLQQHLPGITFQDAKKYHSALCDSTPQLLKKLNDGQIADGVFIYASKQPVSVQEELCQLNRIRERDVKDRRTAFMSAEGFSTLQMAIALPKDAIPESQWRDDAKRYASNLKKIAPEGSRVASLVEQLLDEISEEGGDD